MASNNEELAYEREQERLDRHIEILEREEMKEEQNSEWLQQPK